MIFGTAALAVSNICLSRWNRSRPEPAVAREAVRRHARAAFLCLRLPCAPERYRANNAYIPQRLRELASSALGHFRTLTRGPLLNNRHAQLDPLSPKSASSHSHMRSSRSSFDSTRMLHQRASDLFRFSAKPNQANGSAMPQRTAIGKNDAPPYLAYRIPDNKVSAAVVKPAPNA